MGGGHPPQIWARLRLLLKEAFLKRTIAARLKPRPDTNLLRGGLM